MKYFAIVFFAIFCHFTTTGQIIDSFTLPNVVDGENLSLSSFNNDKAIVIIFYSGKCAYADHYLLRLQSIIDEFTAKGVKFVFINSNNSTYVAEESVEEMKKFIASQNLNVPYLADKEKVAKVIFKATRTPEVFILMPVQNQFQIIYKGAIDDNPQSASDVSHEYLNEALFNLLNKNKIELNQTRPIGCLIK